MRKAVLVFTKMDELTDFALAPHSGAVEVNTAEQTLSGFFSDEELVTACTQFGADIKSMEPPIVQAPNNL